MRSRPLPSLARRRGDDGECPGTAGDAAISGSSTVGRGGRMRPSERRRPGPPLIEPRHRRAGTGPAATPRR